MRQRLCALLVVPTIVAATLIGIATPATAAVPPPPAIDFPNVSSVLSVASEDDRLYVAAEAGLNVNMSPDAVLVIGMDGTLEATIGPIPNAYSVAVHDGILYVTAAEDDEVWRYDVTEDPPTKLGETPVPAFDNPNQLVVVNGRVWFTGICNYDWTEKIGSMALNGTDVQVELPIAGDPTFYNWQYCADLDGSAASNRLFVPTAGLTPSKLAVIDVTADPPTTLTDEAAGQWMHGDFNGGDLAPLTGGTSFAMHAIGATGVDVRRISDLALLQHYEGPGRLPRALAATTANGGFLAQAFEFPVADSGITIWETGTEQPLAEYSVPGIVDQGLAFSQDGTVLVALGVDGLGLHVYRIDPLAIPTSLTLIATPSDISVGEPVDLDGALSVGGGTTPAGRTITITREAPGGATVSIGSDTTAGDGSYHLEDTPPGGGTYIYTATYAGSGHIAPAAATRTVRVVKPKASVSAKVSKGVLTYGDRVRITGHLGAGTQSGALSITAEFVGGGTKVLASGTVDPQGDLSVTFRPPKTATYVVSFAGDAVRGAAKDTAKVRVRVILDTELTGSRSRRGAYEIYRRNSVARCRVAVAPNHTGTKIDVELQASVRGRWQRVDFGTFRLARGSRALIGVRGSSGVNLRVRVSVRGHPDHLGDTSPWMYLRFA